MENPSSRWPPVILMKNHHPDGKPVILSEAKDLIGVLERGAQIFHR